MPNKNKVTHQTWYIRMSDNHNEYTYALHNVKGWNTI